MVEILWFMSVAGLLCIVLMQGIKILDLEEQIDRERTWREYVEDYEKDM